MNLRWKVREWAEDTGRSTDYAIGREQQTGKARSLRMIWLRAKYALCVQITLRVPE